MVDTELQKDISLRLCLPLIPSAFLSWQLIGKTVFIINEQNYVLITLDNVAAMLWEELITNTNFEDVINKIVSNYIVKPSILQQDIQNFINDLLTNYLIEVPYERRCI